MASKNDSNPTLRFNETEQPLGECCRYCAIGMLPAAWHTPTLFPVYGRATNPFIQPDSVSKLGTAVPDAGHKSKPHGRIVVSVTAGSTEENTSAIQGKPCGRNQPLTQ